MLPRGLRPLPVGNPLIPATADEHRAVAYTPPPTEQIIEFDPSEAISGHILKSHLPEMFDIIEATLCGGTIVTYLQGLLDYSKTNESPYREWMEIVLNIEDALIRQGVLNSALSVLCRETEKIAPPCVAVTRSQAAIAVEGPYFKLVKMHEDQRSCLVMAGKHIDWSAIRMLAVNGIGLRELARRFSIPLGSVLAVAKREHWAGVPASITDQEYRRKMHQHLPRCDALG
jgi:hypothetical protein